MKLRLALLLACLLFAAGSAVADTQPSLEGLDAYVQKVMAQWQVPGIAIAVVQDGKVVLAKGYGVRQLGKSEPVDADTLFDIASNTKAFTAAALGTLVAAGKLGWDARAVDYVKPFRLSDPYVTQSITLQDLLTHDSGYCDPGSMWYTSDDTDAIERLRYQKPDYGFRSMFCYNNTLYLTAARFIPAVAGESWNDYVAARFFKPLGMSRTVTTAAALAASSDVASPHALVDGKLTLIHAYWPHNMDIDAPIGGIDSSANDMSRWLLMLLAGGTYGGKEVLPPAVLDAMETPQVVIKPDTESGQALRTWMPGGNFYTYGLGFFMQDYADHKLVWHAGDIDGMASTLAMVPDAHLGVVVLTNLDHSDARFAILQRILQQSLGLPLQDTSDVLYAEAEKSRKAGQAEEQKLAATRRPGASPTLPLAAYAGLYKDDFNGSARVTQEGGRLVLRLEDPDFTGDLEPWHDNTFRVTWRYAFYGKDYVTFGLDVFGKPATLRFTDPSFHFERTEASVEAATP